MKKTFRSIFGFTVGLLLSLFVLVSCGSKYISGDEVGSYYFEAESTEYKLALIADGRLTLSYGETNLDGSYSMEEEVIKIKLSDKTKLEGTYSDEVLRVKYNDIDMSFIRDIEFTVTFDSNGGSKLEPVKVRNGKTVAKPADPARKQYAFVGWTTEKDGNDLFSFNETKITKNTTIYGKWSYVDIVNKLTYELPEGFTTANEAINVVENKDYVLEVPTIMDQTQIFDGWYLEDGTRLTDNNGKSLVKWNPDLGDSTITPKSVLKLSYELLANDTYKASGSEATRELKELTVPAMYNGKKISMVEGFKNHSELEIVNLPATIEDVHPQAFIDLLKMTAVNVYEVKGEDALISSIDGVLFENNGKRLAYYPILKAGTEYIVPNKVTEIGDYAFHGNAYFVAADYQSHFLGELSKIVLPKNITRIGDFAFEQRGGLRTVEFTAGGSLDLTFGKAAFRSVLLKDFVFPENLVEIGDYCFAKDPNLKDLGGNFGDLVLPARLKRLGSQAFNYLDYIANMTVMEFFSGITSVTLPKSLEYMGEGVFGASDLATVTFEADIKLNEIPANSFENTDITTIAIPNSIKTIGANAFAGTKLSEVVIPNGVEVINAGAFSGCDDLTTVTIPASVSKIAGGVFANCNKLGFSNVIIDEANTSMVIEGGVIYDALKENIILVDSNLTSYEMPNTVKTIAPFAFYGNKNLKSITLSSSLELIGANAFSNTVISEITIPASVIEIGDNAFTSSAVATVNFEAESKLEKIGVSAFSSCVNIKTITLPNNLKTISSGAFELSMGLGSIVIPDSVESIGDKAFRCDSSSSLTSVTLPKSLKNLGEHVFEGCSKLMEIKLSADCANFKVVNNVLYTKDSKILIKYASAKPEVAYKVIDGCEAIAEIAMEGIVNLTSLDLNGVKRLNNQALYESLALEAIDLTGLTEIGEYALAKTGIKELKLGAMITVIEKSAFAGTTKLASADLTNIEIIRDGAFDGSALVNITWGEKLHTVERNAFNNCRKIQTLIVPGSLKTVISSFGSNEAKTIIVSEGVEIIERNAFANSRAINEVVLPSTIKELRGRVISGKVKILTVSSQPALDALVSSGMINKNYIQTLKVKEDLNVPDNVNTIISSFTKTIENGFVVYTKPAA